MGVVSWSQAILLLNGSIPTMIHRACVAMHDHRPKKTTHHTGLFHPKPKFSNNQLPTYTPHRGCYTKPFLTLSKFSSSQPESCYLLSTLRGHPKSRRPFELPRLGHTDHHAAKQRNKRHRNEEPADAASAVAGACSSAAGKQRARKHDVA